MKWGVIVILAFASCTRSNPLVGLRPGETCSGQQRCSQGSGAYALCQLGDSCRYLASDGSSFACPSCATCGGAQLGVAQWCIVGGTTGGGGTSGGGTTGGGTTGGGTIGGGTTCDQCATATQTGACASQTNLCFNDPSCVNLANCVNACTSRTCEMGCFDMAPLSAQSEYNGAADCICFQCSSTCATACSNRVSGGSSTGGTSGGGTSGGGTSGGGTSGGGTSGGGTSGGGTSGGGTSGGGTSGGGTSGGGTTGNACSTCSSQATTIGGVCDGQAQTCNVDQACINYAECLHGCTTTACRQQCATTAGSTAVNQYNSLSECVCSNCSACGC